MINNYNKFIKYEFKICPYCLNIHQSINNNTINENLNDKISSLQINVPLKGCVNNCKSCIAKIHNTQDKIKMLNNIIIDENKYFENLKLVRKKCDTAVLTSDHGEPIQNINFIKQFGKLNKLLDNPFKIEIQTTGVLLNDNNISLLKDIGLNVVSLSVFDIFDNINNLNIIDVKKNLRYDILNVCKKIKDNGFILRLSINLIKEYEKYSMEKLFDIINEIKPDQLTFKILWCNDDDNPINQWIKINKANETVLSKISNYIINNNGEKINNNKYIYNDISIFLVENCMIGNYLIIRNDGELYNSWLSCNPIKSENKIKEIEYDYFNENINWDFLDEENEDISSEDFIMFKGQYDYFSLYVIKNKDYDGYNKDKHIWNVDKRNTKVSCYSSLNYALKHNSYIPSKSKINTYIDFEKLDIINNYILKENINWDWVEEDEDITFDTELLISDLKNSLNGEPEFITINNYIWSFYYYRYTNSFDWYLSNSDITIKTSIKNNLILIETIIPFGHINNNEINYNTNRYKINIDEKIDSYDYIKIMKDWIKKNLLT